MDPSNVVHDGATSPAYPQTILITSLLADYQQACLAQLLACGHSLDDAWHDPHLRATPEHTRVWIETELAKVEVSS